MSHDDLQLKFEDLKVGGISMTKKQRLIKQLDTIKQHLLQN